MKKEYDVHITTTSVIKITASSSDTALNEVSSLIEEEGREVVKRAYHTETEVDFVDPMVD